MSSLKNSKTQTAPQLFEGRTIYGFKPAKTTTFMIAVTLSILFSSMSLAIQFYLNSYESPLHVGTLVIIQYTLMFLIMLTVWYLYSPSNKTQLTLLLIAAALTRILLLPVEPYSSNDVYRYLFDGKILLQGLDPYVVPHDAPQLSQLRSLWNPPAEHAKYVTIYPPLGLLLFSIASSAGMDTAVTVWKLITILASVITVYLAFACLRRLNKLRHFPLVALNPILILEAGEAAHLDTFLALSLITALLFILQNRIILAGIAIAAGGLIKIVPILAGLGIFFYLKTWKKRILFSLSLGVTYIGGYAVAYSYGLKPIGSLPVFFEKWRFGSPIFSLLENNLSGSFLIVTPLALALIGFFCIAVFSFRQRGTMTFQQCIVFIQLTLAIPLLLSPVVFPWYLITLCITLCFYPSIPLLIWSAVIPITYEVLNQNFCCNNWSASSWPNNVILAAFIIALVALIFPKKLRHHLNSNILHSTERA